MLYHSSKDLEKVQVLLSSKPTRRRCVEVNNEDVDTSGIVSEAERPLRPFACGSTIVNVVTKT